MQGLYWEINVSRDGEHMFATADRSATYGEKAQQLYTEIRKRFPESEGFKVTVTKWEQLGSELDWSGM